MGECLWGRRRFSTNISGAVILSLQTLMLWSLFPSDSDSVLPACLQFIGDFFCHSWEFLHSSFSWLISLYWEPTSTMGPKWEDELPVKAARKFLWSTRWQGGSKDFVSSFATSVSAKMNLIDDQSFSRRWGKKQPSSRGSFFFVLWATDDAKCTHFIDISGWCSNYFDIRFNFVSFSSIWWHPRCWEMTPRSHCFSILRLKTLGLS